MKRGWDFYFPILPHYDLFPFILSDYRKWNLDLSSSKFHRNYPSSILLKIGYPLSHRDSSSLIPSIPFRLIPMMGINLPSIPKEYLWGGNQSYRMNIFPSMGDSDSKERIKSLSIHSGFPKDISKIIGFYFRGFRIPYLSDSLFPFILFQIPESSFSPFDINIISDFPKKNIGNPNYFRKILG